MSKLACMLTAVLLAVWGSAQAAHNKMTWDDTTPPASTPPKHVVVAGQTLAVMGFHRELQKQFRLTNLEDAIVPCIECTDLEAVLAQIQVMPQPQRAKAWKKPFELNYYYPSTLTDRKSFFDNAKASAAALGFAVTVNYDDDDGLLGQPVCGPSPPAPAGCVTNRYCIQYNQCGRNAGFPCVPCVAP